MQKSNIEISSRADKAGLHATRQTNLRILLKEFSQARIAAGGPTNGTEKAFAEQLQMSKSLLSQLKSSRNISDVIAKQIESCCKKTNGWLSEARADVAPRPAPGEEVFVALARAKYRQLNSEARSRLKSLLAQFQ